MTKEELQERQRVLDLWKTQVMPHREEFIAQMARAYGPLLGQIKEQDIRQRIESLIGDDFEGLYARQEKEVHRRFQSALKDKAMISAEELMKDLPFDSFEGRLQAINGHLSTSAWFASLQDVLGQDYKAKEEMYQSLFVDIFKLGMNPSLTLSADAINDALFRSMAMGWSVPNSGAVGRSACH